MTHADTLLPAAHQVLTAGGDRTSCASTPSGRCRWTRCSRRTPGIRARRWRWRRSPTASGSAFLRFDPAHPIWPNRDRFVLSVGHASMLLYSLLHLTGVQDREPEVRDARRAGGDARRHPPVPAARQPVPGASGVSLDRPASRPPPGRWARGWPRASAWRSRRSGSRATSTGPGSSCSTTTSTRCAATAA